MLDIINDKKYFRGSPYDRGRDRELLEFYHHEKNCPIKCDNCFDCPLPDCTMKEKPKSKRGKK